MDLAWITEHALPYLGAALLASGGQLLLVLGPVLLLAAAMHGVSATIRTRAGELFGARLHIWLTAPGTVIHELGHALFCVLFGHTIREISLFKPRKDGVLGFVTHSWNRKSLYQNAGNFFIGTGPIWLGAGVIVLASLALLGPELLAPLQTVTLDPAAGLSWSGLARLGGEIGRALYALTGQIVAARLHADWRLYLFLYLLFCIGSHVTLSASDLSGAASGLAVIAATLLAFNLATLWLGDFALDACLALARYGVLLDLLLLVALLLNLAVAGLLLLLSTVR